MFRTFGTTLKTKRIYNYSKYIILTDKGCDHIMKPGPCSENGIPYRSKN